MVKAGRHKAGTAPRPGATSTTAATPPVRSRRRASPQAEKTGAAWWAGQVFSWLVLFLVAAILAIMIVIPRFSGATAYTVLTASMEPGLPPGSLAVVRPVDPAQLRIGDVMSYQPPSGAQTVITHRVVSMSATTEGKLSFTARGDANGVDDPPVGSGQILGGLWYHVPVLGHVNSLISGTQRKWLTVVAAVGLLGYAALMAAGAVRDRRDGNRARTAGSGG